MVRVPQYFAMFASAMKNMFEQTNKAFDDMTAVAGKMANMASANFQAPPSSAKKAAGPVSSSAKKK